MQPNSARPRKPYSPPNLKKLNEVQARAFLTSQASRGDQDAMKVLELLDQAISERQRFSDAD